MKLGVIFPQNEMEVDPVHIRQYVETVEELGFDFFATMDQVVLGKGSSTPYDYDELFHEPLTLLGYVSEMTAELELMTSVLVVPARQTVLVAKQTAQIDFLSDGRLHVGIGVGSNELAYQALGTDFTNRGERIEEQIQVLRELWENDLSSFEGEWHEFPPVGVNPRPVQESIPIWIGGGADVTLRRAARMGDGWMTPSRPVPQLQERINQLRSYLDAENRDPDDCKILARIYFGPNTRDDTAPESPKGMVDRFIALQDIGVTHVAVDSRFAGFTGVTEHLDHLGQFMTHLTETIGSY